MVAVPPFKRLSGTAIITGAASGIGRAVTIALATAGADPIWITDVQEAGLQKTQRLVEEIHPRPQIHALIGDISDHGFITKLFAGIDHLSYAVNCAGVLGPGKPSTETSIEEFDYLNSVNYRGMWLCSREELRKMLENEVRPYQSAVCTGQSEAQARGERGSIVNIASQLGIVGRSDAPIYCASKAAILSLTRCDSVDYSPHRIRINSICPGVIKTPMTTGPDGFITERLKDAIAVAPMNRQGLPSEIADAAVFLCSGESSFVTGQGIVVDGGYVIN